MTDDTSEKMKTEEVEINNGQTAAEELDCIVVIDATNNEPIEVPTSDGSVLMSTLQASFPGATGLKYRNPKTGANRVVQVDPNGQKLIAPTDGWSDKKFFVIFATQSERVRGASTQSGEAAGGAKRRKVGSSDNETDSDDESDGRSKIKRAAQRKEKEERTVDLIVLGVDFKTSDETFKSYFDEFGKVLFCEVKRKPDGASKGFGFVRMEKMEEQNKILETSQHKIDGRRCDIKIPGDREKQSQKQLVNRIFVGRLTDRVSEEMLRDTFSNEAKEVVENAKVTDVFIPKPFRGFAFITLSSGVAAEEIVKKGSLMVNGTSVALSLALPREEPPMKNGFPMTPDYGMPPAYPMRRNQDHAYGFPPKQSHDNHYPYGRNDYASYGRGGGAGGDGSDRRYWNDTPNWSDKPPLPPQPRSVEHQNKPMPLMSIRNGPYDNRRMPQMNRTMRNEDINGPIPGTSTGGPANIAYGLDALDLNQTNPEIMNAALSAFFSTLNQSRGMPPPPHKWN